MDNFVIHTDSFQITQLEILIRIAVAIGIGFIIGLEREHAAMEEKAESFAGIRTFIFVVLLGFIGGMTYYLFDPAVYIAILLSVAILTGVSYFITASKGDIGATTEVSVLISFFLGTLAFLGLLEFSLAITVLLVILLSGKFRLHSIIGKITGEELYDFIRFVVIALLLFPFLPDQTYGPFNVINPREIGWVVILTSGLGFIGYMLMKFLGPGKGILFSGIIGGLISSTAVTWVFAKKSKENEAHSHTCAVAILAASSIMMIRVLVWTYIFNKELFNEIYLSIFIIFLTGMGITFFFYYKNRKRELPEQSIRKGKPLDLQGALLFAAIYTVILFVVSYAGEHLGDYGLIISGAIAGLSDIDAITITVSKLAGLSINFQIAMSTVVVAVISNTFVKMTIGIRSGSKILRHDLLIGYGVIFVAAIFSLIINH